LLFQRSSIKNFILVTLIILIAIWVFIPLPEPPYQYSRILYGADGKMMSATTSENQQWYFPLDEKIPDHLKTCIIIYEDEYLSYHPGINPVSIFKALADHFKTGKKLRGASTLPMQVMRMKRGNKKRTYFNKMIEIIYALKYSMVTKDETIISEWSSIAPFGGNTIGIKAAALRYFGRSLDKLSWAEYALLAVMPNGPSHANLSKNRNILKAKRDFLLKKLQKKGFFSGEELVLYLGEEIPIETKTIPQFGYHLLSYLKERYPHHYIFRTTMDTDLQFKTYELLSRESEFLRIDDIKNMAITIIDVRTNTLLAYHGNSPSQNNKFSYVDIIQAPRSYGSLLKPILYAHALETSQFLPNEMIADIPTAIGDFQPENFDKKYRGAVPMDEMIIQSLNVPAVRLLNSVGLYGYYDLIKTLNIKHLDKGADHYGLSIILGGGETSLWELSRLYKGLAQNYIGIADPFREVQIIQEFKTAKSKSPFSFSSFSINHLVNAMSDLNRPREEKSWQIFGNDHKIAWKTGTSYGHKDAWALGFNGSYMVGVWIGNEGGEGRFDLTGISKAAPMMFKIFNVLPENKWFGRAPTYAAKEIISVCKESGKIAGLLCKHRTNLPIEKLSLKYQQCNYHQEVMLSRSNLRLGPSCQGNAVKNDTFFVLPSFMEYYYKQANTTYQVLPPPDPLCQQSDASCKIIYPQNDIKIFLPKESESKTNQLVAQAYHGQNGAVLYWFLDGQYFATTKNEPHDCLINAGYGRHFLVISDQWGNKDEISFEIINERKTN
jgi:penicillin-binding protein 1C